MSWEKFNYICRRVNAVMADGESVGQCIERVESEAGTALYGEAFTKKSLQRQLLNELSASQSDSNALNALSIYASLKLNQWLTKPQQFKRYLHYLFLVIAVYFSVASLYKLKVMPVFLSLLENFGNSKELSLTVYAQNWWAIQAGVAVLLALSIVLAFFYRNLFSLQLKTQKSFGLTFLVTPKLRHSYQNLVELLRFPMQQNEINSKSENSMIKHLRELASSDMDIAIEVKALLEAEAERFSHLAERHIKGAMITTWSTLVVAIFLLLQNTYSPISLLGEAL